MNLRTLTHFSVFFHCCPERSLSLSLLSECQCLSLIDRIEAQNAMACHWSSLSLATQATVELVVQAQAPVQAEPDHGVPSFLQSVDTMSRAGRMSNHQRAIT